MKLLVLGGTVFVGRHIVESALAKGHEVTLFNRGEHNPDLFPQVRKLRGDRTQSLDALGKESWDAVIDTSGYLPGPVSAAVEALRERVPHYTFISSVSVYADFNVPGITEEYPVARLENPATEEITAETYGGLKALCEEAVRNAYGNAALIIRPGLVAGPHDPTDRFTYWPWRVARGGEVLAPDRPELPIQYIDPRDLAEWALAMIESRQAGTFNAVGPAEKLTMKEFLDACNKVTGAGAKFTFVREQFLLKNEIAPWSMLPMWIPVTTRPETRGIHQVDSSRARSAGLGFRDVETTIRDTLEWARTRDPEVEWKAGLKADKEKAVLSIWHTQA